MKRRDLVRKGFPATTMRLAALVFFLSLPELLLAESWPGQGSDRAAAIAGPPLFALDAIMAWLLAYARVNGLRALMIAVLIAAPVVLFVPFTLPGTLDRMGFFILLPIIMLVPAVLVWFGMGVLLGHWILRSVETVNAAKVAFVGSIVQALASIGVARFIINSIYH